MAWRGLLLLGKTTRVHELASRSDSGFSAARAPLKRFSLAFSSLFSPRFLAVVLRWRSRASPTVRVRARGRSAFSALRLPSRAEASVLAVLFSVVSLPALAARLLGSLGMQSSACENHKGSVNTG